MNQPFWNPFAPPPPPQDPWQQGFEAWTKAFSPQPAQANDAVERMTAGAKQFFDFMQAASAAASTGSNPFADAAKQFTASSNPMIEAMRGLNGPGAFSFDKIAEDARSWLNVPAFGLNRATQQRAQHVAQAGIALNDAQAKYQQQLLKATQLAFRKFESKLAERSEPGREVTSLRGLYDLWIDAAEEGYAEIATSKDFQDAYGEVANAQMRLRKLAQEEFERNAQSIGMPTRTELDSVHRKLAELRRRVADLEERLGARDEAQTYAADKPQQSSKPAQKKAKK